MTKNQFGYMYRQLAAYAKATGKPLAEAKEVVIVLRAETLMAEEMFTEQNAYEVVRGFADTIERLAKMR